MKTRKSFILHFDSLDVIDELDNNQIAELFKAIKNYNLGEELNLTGLMKAVFIPFKNQFDRDLEKYKNACDRNKENGLKGGRPSKSENNPNKTKISHSVKLKAKKPYSDSKSDNDNESNNESNNISTDIVIETKVSTLEDYIKREFTESFISDIYNKHQLSKEDFKESCESFVNHWTEKNPGGKKELWQMQKTFDPKKRFRTRISRSNKWNKGKTNKKKVGITTI